MDTPTQAATVAIRQPSAPISSTSTPDEGRFIPGTLVAGRYRIISLLGAGGMGEVYRATDLTLAQPVALKFLSASAAPSERMLERFHNEVRVARQVSHPNVCRVYDVGEADGMPYISMEYVDGEDLASLLTRIGRLPGDKALEMARKICAGVAAAHEKGVIHRDLKPANIMLDKRGNVVVMDFGLAAVAEELNGPEARSGTPAYMAPEQLRGESATPKSDIYALGLVLYELFTGKRVYEAANLGELLRLQESGHITSISSVTADVDPAVEKAVRRCLDPEPNRRPASALALSASLPGGDPLAAALAAGETPSPELVAASGKSEGMPLKISIPVTLAIAVLILAFPFARVDSELHSFTPFEMSADTLANKAREYAAAFGYTAAPADRKYDLHWAWDQIVNFRKRARTKEELRRLFAAEPPLQLGYRESPLPLVAEPDGEVTESRPAPIVSGMIEAWVNSRGELRQFRAVPLQTSSSAATSANDSRDIDPQAIARATGFDLAHWQEITPPYTPLYAFDRIKAWQGKIPTLDIPVTVEVSAWKGRLAELYTIWPWSTPDRMPAQRAPSPKDTIRSLVVNTTSVLVFLFSGFLALRNLRAGRGDKRGAMRLAAAYLLLMAAQWVCSAHWMADIEMFSVLATNAAMWVTSAALIWLLYMGLEPVVRSRWPRSIVTWSRVLVGRWRDPLVGAHVLYGALLGVVIAYCFVASQIYGIAHGQTGGITYADTGMSSRLWIGAVAGTAHSAAEFGLIVVFALFCFRVVLRNDWAASFAAAVLFSLEEGDVWQTGKLVDFAFFVVIFTVLLFVLLRLGLVSMMAAVFFVNLLLQTPAPRTFLSPYEWTVVLYPVLALAIAVWAFWRTSGQALLAPEHPQERSVAA